MRSQYQSAKTKSSSGTADIEKPTWSFFDSLKCLDDNLTVRGTSSSIYLSEVSQFKKKREEVNSSEVDEWSSKESTFVTEDKLFGQAILKSTTKIPDGEIKEELKVGIQQCILNGKRHAPKS